MEAYIEKTMVLWNSGESKTIFRNISRIVLIGLREVKKTMAGGGGTRKDTSIVLIRQE